jgi:hypothetical protein
LDSRLFLSTEQFSKTPPDQSSEVPGNPGLKITVVGQKQADQCLEKKLFLSLVLQR